MIISLYDSMQGDTKEGLLPLMIPCSINIAFSGLTNISL